MAFGIYIHIPYCLQRCTYCDFATYERSKIMPPQEYLRLLELEIQTRSREMPTHIVDTIYFGGGTPSLLHPTEIVSIIRALENQGFKRSPDCEVTIEINPATLNPDGIAFLTDNGVNRFSVGAQTFDDTLLKAVHREHSAHQTRQTLKLLKDRNLNFSADVLFALPGQTTEILRQDLKEVLAFGPSHISPYCLTVPEGHVLDRLRPLEDVQLEMFQVIDQTLSQAGYLRYEISNYCLPGMESRHNSLYWDDQPYWGIGLSSHSYLPQVPEGPWGVRFWNPRNINDYATQIENSGTKTWTAPYSGLPEEQKEFLLPHEALTDYCHTSLRRSVGLSQESLIQKFGSAGIKLVSGPLAQAAQEGLVAWSPDKSAWSLSATGYLLSNQVFRALTFTTEEWNSALTMA